MSYFIQDAVNEYLSIHKMYRLATSGGQTGGSSGATQSAYVSGGGTSGGGSSGGTSGQPGPPPDGFFWYLQDDGTWKLIPVGDPGGGDPGGTVSYSSGGGGRTLAEDLTYMEAKYKWDEKLELKVLAAQWEAQGKHDVTIANLDYKHKKWLQNIGYLQDQKLADISAEHKLTFLREEIGLTKDMKMDLMIEQHGYDKIMQDDRQLFEKLMQADQNAFNADQKGLDRDLQKELTGMDIKSREAISAAQIAAQQAIAAMQTQSAEAIAARGIASQEGMQLKSFTHAEIMQAAQQAFDAVMQKRGFANDQLLQARDLAVRVAINQSQIDSAEKISENKIAADKEMQQKQMDFDKEQKEEDRKLRRFEEVQKLRGKDPVRAALMAMGAGDALDQFSGGFGDLGPMEGAEQLAADTESALQGIEGLGRFGETLTLGEKGVSGLGSVEKAGAAFVQGPASTRTLVTSAQGVGSGEQAGVSEEDVSARIAAITPKGFDTKRAAGGIGPQRLLPMSTNQQYAAEGRGPEADVKMNLTGGGSGTKSLNVGEEVNIGDTKMETSGPASLAGTRPAVEPNTSYTVGEGQTGDGTRPEVVTTGDNNELLSIEPATNDPASETERQKRIRLHSEARDIRKGIVRPGDPLVDMFNDPNLKLGRSETKPGEPTLPVVGGVQPPPVTPQEQQITAFKGRMGMQMQDEMKREGINEADMKQIQAIKASGQPLSPAQEKSLARYDRIVGQYQQSIQDFEKQTLATATAPAVPDNVLQPVPTAPGTITAPGTMGGGSGPINPATGQPASIPSGTLAGTTQPISDRRRAYMESLPPAQQASIRQTQQRALRTEQDQLVKNLTPDTVNKLMELINNPNRNVNQNLQEQLPQMRDGAGNLQAQSPGLARVV